MHHPYQRLAVCAPDLNPRTRFLLAASGHKLFSVNLGDGSVVTQWPKEGPNEEPKEQVRPKYDLQRARKTWVGWLWEIYINVPNLEIYPKPVFLFKYQRTNSDQTEEPEGMEGPPSKKRRMSSTKHEDLPNIIHVVVTASQQHAVVVTAEDKCLRVFEISPEGKLEQLSQRLESSVYVPWRTIH